MSRALTIPVGKIMAKELLCFPTQYGWIRYCCGCTYLHFAI